MELDDDTWLDFYCCGVLHIYDPDSALHPTQKMGLCGEEREIQKNEFEFYLASQLLNV